MGVPTRAEIAVAIREWLWAGYLGVALAAATLAVLLFPSWQDNLFVALAVGSAIAVLVGLALHNPKPRLPWLFLAAGQACLALGELLSPADTATAPTPEPGIGAIFFLSAYPLLALGFTLLVVRRNASPGFGVLLDGAILTVGLGLMAWITFADPLMTMTGLSPLAKTIGVVYLVSDIALIGVSACLVLDTGMGSVSIRLFFASILALLVSDGLFESNQGGILHVLGGAGYAGQYVLWTVAALHPTLARSGEPNPATEHRITPRRLAALMTAALVAPAALTIQGISGSIDFPAISLGSVAIVALVIATMVDLIGEQSVAMQKRLSLEAALRETSETLRAILDAAPLPIVVLDRQRRVLFWSRSAENLFGYTAQEAQGRRIPIFSLNEMNRTLVPRILAGEAVSQDRLECQTKSGQALEVRAHLAPIRDENGRVRSAISILEDTSEVTLLTRQLRESHKLDVVGRLAGGIAHDFNNILTAVIGYAELSLDEPPGTDITEYLRGIRDAAERAAGLTQQLLAFSRRQVLQPKVVEVNEVVGGLESMLRRLIGEQIELRIVLDPNAGCLRADRSQLEQVILNLTVNSRDAMPRGGLLEITTGYRKYVASARSRPREIVPGKYATITVRDTGVGMDEQTREHIFEPFYTTKGQGHGVGLGLATCHGIIMQSDGSVIVDSEVGKGTSFRLFFPSVEPEPEATPEAPQPAPRRAGRILLVEDEPVLREIAQRVLVRAGFEVTAAADPGEAIIAAETMPEPFDLLLTDVVMPGMRGPELARRLRHSRPDLRVLLASGYAEEIVDSDRHEDPLLAKPFSPETLLAAVDAVLGPPEQTAPESEWQSEAARAGGSPQPVAGVHSMVIRHEQEAESPDEDLVRPI